MLRILADFVSILVDGAIELQTTTIQDCDPNTLAFNVERWCSRFRNEIIRAINNEMVDTVVQFQKS